MRTYIAGIFLLLTVPLVLSPISVGSPGSRVITIDLTHANVGDILAQGVLANGVCSFPPSVVTLHVEGSESRRVGLHVSDGCSLVMAASCIECPLTGDPVLPVQALIPEVTPPSPQVTPPPIEPTAAPTQQVQDMVSWTSQIQSCTGTKQVYALLTLQSQSDHVGQAWSWETHTMASMQYRYGCPSGHAEIDWKHGDCQVEVGWTAQNCAYYNPSWVTETNTGTQAHYVDNQGHGWTHDGRVFAVALNNGVNYCGFENDPVPSGLWRYLDCTP